MKRLLTILLISSLATSLFATNYYMDQVSGNDANDGLTPSTPRQSTSVLQVLLNSATGGDTIFLARGSHWRNVELSLFNTIYSGDGLAIEAYGTGEFPIVSAQKLITSKTDNGGNNWTLYDASLPTNEYKEIYFTPYDISPRRYWNYLNFLIIDGQKYAIGQYPNNGDGYLDTEASSTDWQSWLDDYDVSWSTNQWQGGQCRLSPDLGPSYGDQGAPFISAKWAIENVPILGSSSQRLTLDAPGGWSPSSVPFYLSGHLYGRKTKYVISNHPNANNSDGEWSIDHASRTIDLYSTQNISSVDVEMSVKDYALIIDNVQNLSIRNVEFRGGVNSTIEIRQSNNIILDSVNTRYSPHNGVFATRCDNLLITNGDMQEGCNNGILLVNCSNARITHTRLYDFGNHITMGGDREEVNYTGIYDFNRYGDIIITRNLIDSIGYSPVNSRGNKISDGATFSGDLIVDLNILKNGSVLCSDGAAGFYAFEDDFTGANIEKSFSDNVIISETNNESFYSDVINQTYSFYLDGACLDYVSDNNTTYGTSGAIHLHQGGSSTMSYNKAFGWKYTSGRRDAWYASDYGFGHSGATENCNVSYNEIVATASDQMVAGWGSTSNPINVRGSTANYNKYFNLFNSTNQIFDLYNYSGGSSVTISEWRSATGLDLNSTVNNPLIQTYVGTAYEYDPHKVIKLVTNIDSTTTRVVDLYDLSFRDIDGNLVTGSVTLDAWQPGAAFSKFLFYEIGTGTVDSLDYIVEIPNLYSGAIGDEECSSYTTVYDTVVVADSVLWEFNNSSSTTYGDETLSGTFVYEGTNGVCNGSHSLHENSSHLTTGSIALADSFHVEMCYTVFHNNYGWVLSSNKSTGSGWRLIRQNGYLEFETENSSGAVNSSSSAAGTISSLTTHEIEVIVNKTDGYASFIIDGVYSTGSDSTIRTDFNTTGSVSINGDLSGGNKPYAYFDDFQLKYFGESVTSYQICNEDSTYVLSDTLKLKDYSLTTRGSKAYNSTCGDTAIYTTTPSPLYFSQFDYNSVNFSNINALEIRYEDKDASGSPILRLESDAFLPTLGVDFVIIYSTTTTGCRSQLVDLNGITSGVHPLVVKVLYNSDSEFTWIRGYSTDAPINTPNFTRINGWSMTGGWSIVMP